MSEITGCCGYRCDLCQAYRENVVDSEHQQKTVEGWLKYYGDHVPPEEAYCDGCLDKRKDAKRLTTDCSVRACAMETGLPNCAHCEKYLCEKSRGKVIKLSTVQARLKDPISQEDYEKFVGPYESDKELNRIRQKSSKPDALNDGEIQS